MLTSKVHGSLDYITAVFFLASPTLFSLSETGTLLAYTLAVVHFLMTFFTGFSMGVIKVIPFKFHGYVELIVSIFLIAVTWLLADFFSETDRIFYTICGIVILAVWGLTSYESPLQTE